MYQASDYVGKKLAELLKQLHSYGTPFDKMHLIGHGIGAHIAGGAANYIAPAKVDRITGK